MDPKGKTEMHPSYCMIALGSKPIRFIKSFHAQNFHKKAKLLAYYIPKKGFSQLIY